MGLPFRHDMVVVVVVVTIPGFIFKIRDRLPLHSTRLKRQQEQATFGWKKSFTACDQIGGIKSSPISTNVAKNVDATVFTPKVMLFKKPKQVS